MLYRAHKIHQNQKKPETDDPRPMNTQTLLKIATLLFVSISLASCSFVPAGGGPQGPGQVQYQNQGYLMEWHDTTGGGDTIDHSKTHHSNNAASPDGQEVRITQDVIDLNDEEFGNMMQRLKNRRQ